MSYRGRINLVQGFNAGTFLGILTSVLQQQRTLLDAEQFHFEDERAVRRDRAGTIRAVRQIRRNLELELVAYFHQLQAFRPAGNDLVQSKADWLAASDGTIENRAIKQFALVMHFHGVRGFGRNCAGAMFQDEVFQAAGCRYHLVRVCRRGRRARSIRAGIIVAGGWSCFVTTQQAQARRRHRQES